MTTASSVSRTRVTTAVVLGLHSPQLWAGVVVAAAAAGALAAVAPMAGVAIAAASTGDADTGFVSALAVIGLVAVHLLLASLADVTLSGAGERVALRLRALVARRIAVDELSPDRDWTPADVLSRAGWEIDQIAAFSRDQLASLVIAVAYLIAAIGFFATQSPGLALLAVGLYVPLGGVILWRFARTSVSAFDAEADALAALSGSIVEGAAVREALQDESARRYWTLRVKERSDLLQTSIVRTVRALNLLPLLGVVEALALAGIVLAGGWAVIVGDLGLAAFSMFVVAGSTLFVQFNTLGGTLGALQTTRVHARRVSELLAPVAQPAQLASEDERDDTQLVSSAGLAARGIGFGYGAHNVLTGVSAEFPLGSRTVVVGPSGAGKSTFAKVLAGLYEPSAGTVSLDGDDLRGFTPERLRARVVIVPQENHLLSGSLLDNALTSRSEVEATLAELGLDDWVTGLGGIDADLHRGQRLSEGERQLVGVVRALSRRPDVLILDETTAQLDPSWICRIFGVLGRRPGLTLIAVAHDRGIIDGFDRVLRLPPDPTPGGHP